MATKEKITVVALEKGFHGGQIRNPGETFAVEKGSKASWFEEVAKTNTPTTDADLV